MGHSRNHGIFKVVGANFKDKKGKPKEVTSKLKKNIFSDKLIANKNKSKIEELDATLQQLQKSSVLEGKSLSGEKVAPKKVSPAPLKETVMETEVTDLTDMLSSSITK